MPSSGVTGVAATIESEERWLVRRMRELRMKGEVLMHDRPPFDRPKTDSAAARAEATARERERTRAKTAAAKRAEKRREEDDDDDGGGGVDEYGPWVVDESEYRDAYSDPVPARPRPVVEDAAAEEKAGRDDDDDDDDDADDDESSDSDASEAASADE